MSPVPTSRRPLRLRRLKLFCAGALAVAGCASPPPHYYTLTAAAPPSTRPSTAMNDLSIAVGPVSLPALVDRPQIVVSAGGNEVRLEEYQRWASPLQDSMARVVADDLAAQLTTARVAVLAQSGTAEARYRVAIDVQGFVSQPGVLAQLDATWTVRRACDDASRSGRSMARVAVSDAGYAALASAHSQALAQLAAAVAAAIRELESAGR